MVCAAQYRRVVCSEHGDGVVQAACLEIAKRDELVFGEIGTEKTQSPFSESVRADVESHEDCSDGEASDRAARVRAGPRGQEAALGWGGLGKRGFHPYGGIPWE